MMMDPKTRVVPYVWKGTDLDESYKWLESISKKEKFQGLTPVRSSRLLWKGRYIQWNRAIAWLNVILLIVLVAKLVTM